MRINRGVPRRPRRQAASSKYEGVLAKFYDVDHRWRDYDAQASLVRSLPLPRRARILDVCCGSGSHAILLARKGFRVTGVDQSEALLAQARSKTQAAGSRTSFFRRDVFSLGQKPDFPSRFDGAILLGWTVSIDAMYRRFPELLNGVARVLKPGGFFVFDVAVGSHFHPAPDQPIEYILPTGLKGALTIREDKKSTSPLKAFFYHWEISRSSGSSCRSITTREVLRMTRSAEIFSLIKKCSRQFEAAHYLREYRLDRPYRKGDKNLIVALRRLDGAVEQE